MVLRVDNPEHNARERSSPRCDSASTPRLCGFEHRDGHAGRNVTVRLWKWPNRRMVRRKKTTGEAIRMSGRFEARLHGARWGIDHVTYGRGRSIDWLVVVMPRAGYRTARGPHTLSVFQTRHD